MSKPEPPETEAAQAGAEIERTSTEAGETEHSEMQGARRRSDDEDAVVLTTDPEAQTDDSVIKPDNS